MPALAEEARAKWSRRVCSNKTGPELLSTGNFGGHRKDWLLRVHCENCLCWENKSRVCAGVLEYASLSRQFVSGNKRKENQLDYPNKESRVPCFIEYIFLQSPDGFYKFQNKKKKHFEIKFEFTN